MAVLVTNLEISLSLVLVWVTFLFRSLEFILVYGTVHRFSFTFHQLTSHLSEHWMSIAQLYPTLCDPMDRSLPSPSVHKLLQARILEWVAISFFRSEHYLLNNTFFWLTWSIPSTTYEISQFLWICIWRSIQIHHLLIHLPHCLNYCSFITCITTHFNFFSFLEYFWLIFSHIKFRTRCLVSNNFYYQFYWVVFQMYRPILGELTFLCPDVSYLRTKQMSCLPKSSFVSSSICSLSYCFL